MTVLGFDFDSTLVKAFTAIPLPGVPQRIAALPPDQRLFIATNQAGPTFRAVTGDTKYPTGQKVANQLADGLFACGLLARLEPLILVATAAPQLVDSEGAAGRAATDMEAALIRLVPGATVHLSSFMTWRKPQPGMLQFAALVLGVSPAELLYIGDMETDRQAAAAAGAQYLDVADWMRGEETP